jgi:hypothetical protein
MKLISVSELKEILEKTDDQHDSLLDLIIEYISADLESAMNRKLEKMQRTEYFSGGCKVFALQAPPIDLAQPFTLTLDGQAESIDNDYYVHENSGIVEFVTTTNFTDPKQIAITYTGGYPATGASLDAPKDMKMACLLQSAFIFRRRKDLGINQLSMPDGSIGSFLTGEFLPQVQKIVDRNRLDYVG